MPDYADSRRCFEKHQYKTRHPTSSAYTWLALAHFWLANIHRVTYKAHTHTPVRYITRAEHIQIKYLHTQAMHSHRTLFGICLTCWSLLGPGPTNTCHDRRRCSYTASQKPSTRAQRHRESRCQKSWKRIRNSWFEVLLVLHILHLSSSPLSHSSHPATATT